MSFDNRSSAVEGNSSSNPEMQTLCKTGCGFYGSPVQEGLCSKCHKDKVKHLLQIRSSNSSSTACAINSTVQSEARFLRTSSSPSLVSSKHERSSEASGSVTSAHRETSADQQRTPEPVIEQTAQELLTAATNIVLISSTEAGTESTAFTEPEASTMKPKKNRCLACNKRVGLTGFGCRCGGLFCSMHRYSDMHSCSFDYKGHAQGQIRKNNPVVMGSKITKI